MRSLNFVRYASSVADVVGVSILRPLPAPAQRNADAGRKASEP
jgi:hypothetical protein